MRKTIVTNIISIDGYYEGPGRNVMTLPMDAGFDTYNLERLQSADTVLLGRNSFLMFSSFWPQMADNPNANPTHREFSRIYNQVEKVVISNSLREEETGAWRETTRIIGGKDVYNEISELRSRPGKDIVIYGSRTLWNNLLAQGLIDELHFVVGNVVLKSGKPAFNDGIAYDDQVRKLRLMDVQRFENSQNTLAKYAIDYGAK